MSAPAPPRPRRQRHDQDFHLRVHIDADAYALLKRECYQDASGRTMGLGRVVNKCIYVALGHKYGRRDPED